MKKKADMRGSEQKNRPDIERLLANLATGNALDELIGESGHLYMDRPHPYLCIHRRASEEDTGGAYRLLAGMGAVFLLPTATDQDDEYVAWLHYIAAAMVDIFGAFLLVEVWPSSAEVAADAIEKEINFHIHTTEQHVERNSLQTIEGALIAHDWHGFKPFCTASFEENPGPKGFQSLVQVVNVDNMRRFYLGLEVDAVFRDPQTGSIRPQVLRSVGADFSACLKQAIFAFAKSRSKREHEHHHQLGSRIVTKAATEADAILTKVGQSVDLVFYATPVNVHQAWTKFERCQYKKAPEFHYRPLVVHHGHLKKLLYEAPVDSIEDPAMHFIFAERRDELDRQITMLGDRGKPEFLLGSQQLFARPDTKLLEIANSLLESIEPESPDQSDRTYLSAVQFAELAREMIQNISSGSSMDARVEIRDDLPGIMVSNGHLLIGRRSKFKAERVVATLSHEIGTHILTHHNGACQPFTQLQVGLAGYQALQEGLAVVAEYLSGGLTPERIRQLASRVLAVDTVIRGADFIDTFRLLEHDYHFEPRAAFMTTMRAHRSGGLTKDAVYLQGAIEALSLLGQGHKLEDLLIGKFAAAHVDIIEELQWRKILKPCHITPPFLAEGAARDKLRVLAKGRSIHDLVGDWPCN